MGDKIARNRKLHPSNFSSLKSTKIMKCPKCGHEFKNPIASKGGAKSKRAISPEAQAKMQATRKANREKKKQK